jgi:group I intron endonuclease
MIGIYKITSPSGKVYIGQSVDINKRIKTYKRLQCKSQVILYKSFLKHDVNNHIFEIIEECVVDLLNERERYWQDYYDVLGKNGLNCHLTSSFNLKMIHSKEVKNKISSKLKEIYTKQKGGFYGKKHSEETKLKMSESGKIKNFSETHRNNLRLKGLGRKMSEQSKKNLSIQRKINNPVRRLVLNYDTGIFYDSILDAAIAYNINYNTLKTKLRKNDKNFNFKRV